jgi:serine phosphatase RsbU (regulator of sigma subunit)/pSer/pThr/pTyr-binding forkhead associated (FHA) protein
MGDAAALRGLLKPASLVVISPSGQRSRLPLDPLPFLIGRQAGNHLVLRDNRVSRVHARIVADTGNYVVEDAGSRHGVWVNGERVMRRPLATLDRIEFGVAESYQVVFRLDEESIERTAVGTPLSSASSSGELPPDLAKLRAMVEVARAMRGSLTVQEILKAVVDAALAVTGCERGFVLLREGGELVVSVARDRNRTELSPDDLRVPTRLIRQALESRRELLSMSFDPQAANVSAHETVAALELRSAVCVPLIRVQTASVEDTHSASPAQDTVGVLYLDSRAGAADLSSGSRDLLQTLALEASTILENARLLESEQKRIRMEDELRIARDIQMGLQPSSLPVDGWLRAAGVSIPCTQVGGDYWDVHRVAPDVWAVVVADVSGKGVSSALLASLLQGAFFMVAPDPAQIGRTLGRVNDFLLERTRGEKYATIFFALIHRSGQMRWANAGHCAPFLLHPDGSLKTLGTTGMPVGMIEGVTADVMEGVLQPGDKIVIYSDGLTEAVSPSGEYFDTQRLRRLLKQSGSLNAAGLHARLLEEVRTFTAGSTLGDDVTAVVLEFAGS